MLRCANTPELVQSHPALEKVFGYSRDSIMLVICYGLGMAGTLTAAGLLLVSVRDRIARMERTRTWRDRAGRFLGVLPVATAVLVLVVGIGLALRSLSGV